MHEQREKAAETVQTFESLGCLHIEYWMMFVRASKAREYDLASICGNQLLQNVSECCARLDKCVPCLGKMLRSRFEHSARTELGLLVEEDAQRKELESCHKSISVALGIFYKGPNWSDLWAAQREAMIAYLHRQKPSEESRCYACACALGLALEAALAGRPCVSFTEFL
jgi:hypothetical protein